MVTAARSCGLEMLLCRVVQMAAKAARMAVGGWSVSLQRALMDFEAWYPGRPVVSRTKNLLSSSCLAMKPARPLATDMSPALEENGVTIAVSM